ncbi:hypothetical protein ACFPZ0_15145 [Streptomonospora nanhaiensis]|uniref:hypothetical protein n=1 Tax=Streptomonospora nanhaiensis TaxID=1323731 RepID=UPI001C393112|nr:hypothetical protein [Streptomonospora nanhaiensis]MBV2366433.1 hypothetical protein [Streptomonospora nanhaiensis]MBX9390426.1 hypothetical protein [Streptomonospora nanhaiensis]
MGAGGARPPGRAHTPVLAAALMGVVAGSGLLVLAVFALVGGLVEGWGPVECGGEPMTREHLCYEGAEPRGYEEVAREHAAALTDGAGLALGAGAAGAAAVGAGGAVLVRERRRHDEPGLFLRPEHRRAPRCASCGNCTACAFACWCG